jgi:hypothetical protein
MDRGCIILGGAKKYPFFHCFQRGRISSETQLRLKRGFYSVVVTAKGGECWTWCYDVGIDFKEV